MARTFDITSSRAAGFALLKPAEKPQLDAARIATLSGTIAVNALAMGLLMMPLTVPPPAVVVDRQRKALEEAIRAVEASYAEQSADDDFDSVLAGLAGKPPYGGRGALNS